MSLLSDYRAKFPIYKDVSDDDLATALHSKYYSDIPYDEFSSKVGLAKVEPEPVAEEKGYFENLTDTVKDVGTGVMRKTVEAGRFGLDRANDVVQGSIAVPEAAVGLADIPTGGRVGKALEEAGFKPDEAKQFLSDKFSDEQKAANQAVSDADGFFDKATAAIKNPRSIASAVTQSAPLMGAGGIVGRGAVAFGANPVIAGAVGEGIIGAGSAAEGTRQQTKDGLLTNKQSGLAVASGLGTALTSVIGGKLAEKLGIVDIDTVIAGGVTTEVKKSLAKRLVLGGISEGVFEEMPQSAQEQILSNIALDKPLTEGVDEAAAMGLLSGAAMGGGASAILGGKDKTPNGEANPAQPDSGQLLTISQGDPADDLLAAQKQADYDAQQRQAASDLAVTKVTDEANTIDDAIQLAETAIDTPLVKPSGLLSTVTQPNDIYADDILGDSNVSNQNDAVTSMVTAASESANSELQGSVDDLSLQSDGRGVDNVTEAPTPSLGSDQPTGNAGRGNDAVTAERPFATADNDFLPKMRSMTTDAKVISQIDAEMALRGLVDNKQDEASFKAGDTVTINGDKDGNVHTVESVGDDGYIYLKSGAANTPDNFTRAVSTPDKNNGFGGTNDYVNGASTPSFQDNVESWKNKFGPTTGPVADTTTVPVAETKAPKIVVQNRDRSQPESINQMRLIAANPDPSRLSFSRDAANGAPVVAGELPASAVLGKLDHALTANNRKLPMQYAVVEASDVIASNDVNGLPNAEYGNGSKLQAIGGNGRIAGLQEAFRNNNGANYIQGIAEDSALHGVPAEAIRGMKNPVLIRVMNSADITPTIGDELNGRTNMGLSVLEQAKTDTARLKLEALDFNENGEVTQDAIKAFVLAMPENERNELMDGGRVGRKAEERLMAAIFAQAYNDDELVRIYSQAQDVESKAVINALAIAAPAMARLTDAGNLDIRSIVADAAKVAVNSSREGVSLTKLAAQGDLELGNDVMAVVRFMAQNIRRPKVIGEELTKAAQFAYDTANQSTMAMFDLPNITRDDIIRKVANDYQGSEENLGEQGRGQPDGSNVRDEAIEGRGQTDTQAPESLELTGQTNEEINAGIAAQEAEAKAKTEAEKADAAAKVEAERKARQAIAADSFDLTQTGKDAKTTKDNDAKVIDNQFAGQGDLLTAPASDTQPEAKSQAKADLDAALGDLGDIFGKTYRADITPEQEQKIIPVLTRVFDAAFRLGYYEFKAAAKFVMDTIRTKIGSDVADLVTLDYLQGAYISMAGKYKDQATSKKDVVNVESLEELQGNSNVTNERSSTDLERDSGNAGTSNEVGAESIQAGRAGNGRTGRSGVQSTETKSGSGSSEIVPNSETISIREQSNIEVQTGQSPSDASIARDSINRGSGDSGLTGQPIEPEAAERIDEVAQGGLFEVEARRDQKAADAIPQELSIENIRETLPILKTGQQEDVLKAETRFAEPEGYGMLFTNGTGTGKTFTGLGIIKRFANRGKTNILVVAPNDKIIEDWQKSGKLLGLNLNRLDSTTDSGTGIIITTYANMGANQSLADRNWDLVVHDEAHYLAMDKDGTNTNALKTLRAITKHPDGAYLRHQMMYRAEYEKQKSIRDQLQVTIDKGRSNLLSDKEAEANDKENDRLSLLLDEVNESLRVTNKIVQEDVKESQGLERPRALFLSATPFAYEKTVDWANGYLFDYNEGQSNDKTESRGYNSGSNRERFIMQQFGYRMRFNKLTAPDAKVNSGLMQRQFNSFLKKKGSLSGRMLDVDADYDRKFILVDSAIGARIDEALQWFEEKRKAIGESPLGTKDPRKAALYDVQKLISEKFDYLSRRYLLESIKAREVITHVKEHMAIGRKVVVFHDYKKGGGFNPFDLQEFSPSDLPDTQAKVEDINQVIQEFRAEFRDLINSPEFKSTSPIDAFKKEFPSVLLFNGDVPAKKRRENVATFNDDNNGPQVILVQSAAGKEGISLHDTTGKHQRVLFNLGQPTQPTTSIQQEGRIYRTGQVTDAIFRYLNTGTNWERWAFARDVANRASAAENLALGEQARALKDAFISAFEESDDYRAGMELEGKGGKERDKAANEALTEYDRAKAFYYGTQKKTSKTKAQEGADYFATPEPVGLKMIELADIRAGERVLEPSAGHGAIARWMPEGTEKFAIEPSSALRPRLAMVFDGNIISSDFEDLNIVNKFDAIVMNPPFGSAGRTAIDHVIKASNHLKDGGRIVALIPVGSTDKKFDKWFYETETRALKPLTTIAGFGDIYKGDTLKTRASWMNEGKVVRVDDSGAIWLKKDGSSSQSMVSVESVTALDKTGKRTEEYSPAKGLSLVAEIKLPSVTFERAGTAVNTRIVVIEKSDNAPQQTNRDYTQVTDINDLFDRMETLSIPARALPVNDDAAAAETKPAAQTKPALESVSGDFDIKTAQFEHSRTKDTMYVAALGKRLEREEYDKVNAIAKANGGYYSAFKGAGAIQGFLFKSVEARQAFISALNQDSGDTPMFSRDTNSTQSNVGVKSKDQSSANALNRAMVRYLDDTWSNAYEQTDLPDSLANFAEAAEVAYGTKITAVRPTGRKFNVFNGINVGKTNYINIESDVSFINITGHEIYHDIERNRPDLHEWLKEQANNHYQDFYVYKDKLNALVQEGETKYNNTTAQSELLADFMGDAMADPVFVGELAKANPSKFKQLLKYVTQWLGDVANKLKKKDLGSSKYFDDVEAMRRHLNKVITAYSMGKTIEEIQAMQAPQFSRESNVLVSDLFKELTLNEDFFQYGKSNSKDMKQVFDEVLPPIVKVDVAVADNGVDEQYNIYPIKDGKVLRDQKGIIKSYDDGKVEIDVLNWKEGFGGSGVYAAVSNWSYNNGKVFAGDRVGITAEGKLRRLENMISAALKYGTTDHIAPHPEQMQDLNFDWREGDTEYNLGQMLEASYNAIRNGVYATRTTIKEGMAITDTYKSKNALGVAKIDDLIYDFDKQQFIELSSGKPYTDEKFRLLAKSREARATHAGSTTLKRAVLAHTFMREESGTQRKRLLELVSQFAFQSLENTQLNQVFYSRNNDQTNTPQFKAWFKDSKVVDKLGNPLEVFHGSPDARFVKEDGTFKSLNERYGQAGGERAFWFASSRQVANTYADDRRAFDYQKAEAGIVPAYLSIQNPLIVDGGGKVWREAQAIGKTRTVIEKAQEDGHDGVIIKNVKDDYNSNATSSRVTDTYVVFSSNQIKSSTDNNGDFDPANPDIRFSRTQYVGGNLTPETETRTEALQRAVQDQFAIFKRTQEKLLANGGVVGDRENVYEAMMRYPARFRNKVIDFMRGTYNPIIDRIAKIDTNFNEIGRYMLALHAKEGNAYIQTINEDKDAGVGMTNAEAAKVIKEAEARTDFAEFDSIARDLQNITNMRLNMLVTAGVYSQDQADAMRKQYQFYVPVKGFADLEVDDLPAQFTGSGFSTTKKLDMRRKGRKSEPSQIVENIIRDYQVAVAAVEKANVGRYLRNLVAVNPNNALWTLEEAPTQKVIEQDKRIWAVMDGSDEVGRFTTKREASTTAALFNKGSSKNAQVVQVAPKETVVDRPIAYDREQEVRFIENGKEYRIQLKDPLMAAAYNGLNKVVTNNVFVRGADNILTFFREMWTQKSPVFIVLNGFLRDPQSALAVGIPLRGLSWTKKMYGNYISSAKALYQFEKESEVTNERMRKHLENYRKNGGGIGYAYVGDIDQTQSELNKALRIASGNMNLADKAYNNQVIKSIEVLNAVGENALRFAAYVADVESGRSMLDAVKMSKEITVNFNRKGEMSAGIGRIFLFANSNIQGINNLIVQPIKQNPKVAAATFGSFIATGFMLGMMEALLNSGEDDEENDDLFEENSRMMSLRIGDMQIKLDNAYGVGWFVFLGRMIAKTALRPETAGSNALNVSSAFFDHFSFMGNPIPNEQDLSAKRAIGGTAPTLIAPFVYALLNTSRFGNDLYPDYDGGSAPDAYRSWKGTKNSLYADAAVFMNEATGGNVVESGLIDISPETLKMVTNYGLGGVGTFFGNTGSSVVNLIDGNATSQTVPFVNRWYDPLDVQNYQRRFYNEAGKAREFKDRVNKLYKAGLKDRAKELRDSDRDLYKAGIKAQSIWKQVNSLREKEIFIKENEDLTKDEKKAQMEANNIKRIEIMRKYHNNYIMKQEQE